MKHSITIDIINDKAVKLLQDLEGLKLIRLHKEKPKSKTSAWIAKYKGAMKKQPLKSIDVQLSNLRSEWE